MEYLGRQFGNYQLLAFLGSGGFAEVYLGKHVHLESLAALKILRTSLPNDDRTRFLAEARTLVALSHPHIIRVLDFGIQDSLPFLVMDYAPNGTLRQRHPKGTQLPLPIILPYVHQVADALLFAHQQKLIHRDVKPENLLIGKQGEILLGDFGIAVVAQSSRYQGPQDMAGTIAYMAPEQIQSHPGPASDQYALGVVVYEWLSGDTPFHGTFTEIAAKQAFIAPPSLQKTHPSISPLIESVVLKALAKDPAQRFPDVSSFALALEQADQGTFLLPSNQGSLADESLRPTVISANPFLVSTGEGTSPEPTKMAAQTPVFPTYPSQHVTPTRSKSLLYILLLSLLLGLLLAAGIIFSPLQTLIHQNSRSTPLTDTGKTISISTRSAPTSTSTPTVAPSAALTPAPTLLPTPTIVPPTPLPTGASPVVQLKAFYTGNAHGSLDATMTFTLKSEDQQGNVVLEVTFQHVDNPQKFAHYLCQGTVTTTRNLTLHCVQEEVSSYLMDIQGFIYDDGHMEGTDTATNANDATYNNHYTWSAT